MSNSVNAAFNGPATANNSLVRANAMSGNNNAVSAAIGRHHNVERLQHRLSAGFNNSSSSGGIGPINGVNSNVLGVVAEKYVPSEQCDMTPSPSDSGISDLEATSKERDLELSFFNASTDPNLKASSIESNVLNFIIKPE